MGAREIARLPLVLFRGMPCSKCGIEERKRHWFRRRRFYGRSTVFRENWRLQKSNFRTKSLVWKSPKSPVQQNLSPVSLGSSRWLGVWCHSWQYITYLGCLVPRFDLIPLGEESIHKHMWCTQQTLSPVLGIKVKQGKSVIWPISARSIWSEIQLDRNWKDLSH